MARHRRTAAVLALLAGVAVYLLSTWVFPYGAVNHDGAVYLQQAAMLLDGKLFLRPPVAGAFRPWFFVRDGARLYPKYAPVPAAIFALGQLAGDASLALAAVGAAVVGLADATVAEAFDRRTGLLAAGLVAASPLFLVDAATFLPYAPTAALELGFAFAYLRADRTGRRGWAALAGAAIGLAFFARPYTAVCFAVPFVAHALWVSRTRDRDVLVRVGTTALVGVAGVALALGYNAIVTGSPLLFPYRAFAPADGLGFGRRAMLGYSIVYTPALAVHAAALELLAFATQWFAAGLLGSALAAVGLGAFLRRARRRGVDARQVALAGLLVSVIVGNLLFWGNRNLLGSLADPTDGLIASLGPYYHFDLLVPTAAFAARGALALAGRWRGVVRARLGGRGPRVALAGVVVGALVLGVVGVGVAAPPIRENRATTDQLAAAYRPVESRDLSNAVVFLPTPYGDWLNHPFQALRNDPGFDGDVVYAIRVHQLAVAAAYPDRSLYRYVYRGAWSPRYGPPVDARLQRLHRVSGDPVRVDARVGVPAGAEAVSIRLAAGNASTYYAANATPGSLPLRLTVDGRAATLAGPGLVAQDRRSVPVGDATAVRVAVVVDYADGSALTYRIDLPVAAGNGTVRALTPYLEACTRPRRCGGEAAYLSNATAPAVFARARFVSTSGGSA